MKAKTTISIITVNIICFILTLGGNIFLDKFGNTWSSTFFNHEYYRLFTCIFLHAGFSHIICNTISLLQSGILVESIYGRKVFIFTYIFSGIFASFCSAFINMLLGRNILSVGASGAICGLLGLFLADFKGDKESKLKNLIIILLPIIIIGFTAGVDNIAHFGGVLGGFIIGRIVLRKKY